MSASSFSRSWFKYYYQDLSIEILNENENNVQNKSLEKYIIKSNKIFKDIFKEQEENINKIVSGCNAYPLANFDNLIVRRNKHDNEIL